MWQLWELYLDVSAALEQLPSVRVRRRQTGELIANDVTLYLASKGKLTREKYCMKLGW